MEILKFSAPKSRFSLLLHNYEGGPPPKPCVGLLEAEDWGLQPSVNNFFVNSIFEFLWFFFQKFPKIFTFLKWNVNYYQAR